MVSLSNHEVGSATPLTPSPTGSYTPPRFPAEPEPVMDYRADLRFSSVPDTPRLAFQRSSAQAPM